MKYKQKHLSKYCCKPANELEFEAVKMAAEIGGVEFDCAFVLGYHYFITSEGWRIGSKDSRTVSNRSIISVLDFCNKLRMSEEEAEKLEDDRVSFYNREEIKWMWTDKRMSIEIQNGFKATVNEDGTEVTLHKRESC